MTYATYWMSLRLHLDAVRGDTPHTRKIREAIYVLIRERSGETFESFGDDVDRWLDWLEADDTRDAAETACRWRATEERLFLPRDKYNVTAQCPSAD